MKKLRLSILALVAILTIFYNIERLDFQQTNMIDIPSYVYAMEFAIVTFVLTLPLLWRSPLVVSLLAGSVLYTASHVVIPDSRPLIGGIYTYISISEIALLLISILIAHTIARSLHEFHEAVENITFGDVKRRVRRQSEAAEDIKTEMVRSRRYGHAMSVVVVEPDPRSIRASLHRMVHEVQQAMMSRYVFLGLARVIRGKTRRMDIVMEQDNQNRLIILCPETQPEGAARLMSNIRQASEEQFGLSLEYSIASFPDEALTFDDLVTRAVSRLPIQTSSRPDASDKGVPRSGNHPPSSLHQRHNLVMTESME